MLHCAPLAWAELDAITGLRVLAEVYVITPDPFTIRKTAELSLAETLGTKRPQDALWFVRPIKSPPEPFSSDDFAGLAAWLSDQKVTGLALNGHAEIGDGQLARLKGLNLTFLSLPGTSITDASLPVLRGFKKLQYLDVSGTRLSADAWDALTKGRKIVAPPQDWASSWVHPEETYYKEEPKSIPSAQ
jgi:hypothetical protein